jgi:Rab3 GTPase-activating protein regulatory subunit N-terminus
MTKRDHFQALVYFPSFGSRLASMNDDSCNDLNPTFAFYSTEGTSPSLSSIGTMNDMEQSIEPPRHSIHLSEHDENYDDYDDGILLVSVTKAIVGTAFGAIRWGLTGGGGEAHRHESSPKRDGSDSTAVTTRKHHTKRDGTVNRQPFVERPEPIPLHMSTAFHDLPRMIEHCSVDPEGRLVAAADSLGRILLIDLSTKHIIRLWKGFRDATCYWIQQFRNSSHDNKSGNQQKLKTQLYVVIHSRQRRIVEVWPVRYGDRVQSISVGRDAKVIPFWVWATNCTQRIKQAQCCIAQSTVPGSNLNRLEIINVSNIINTSASNAANNVVMVSNSSIPGKKKGSITSPKPPGVVSRNGALRLKQLQQLLSATQIQCTIDDVRDALHEITSLVDLATAIDLLATSPGLEDKLKVDGASFHREVVKYCKDILTTIVRPDGTVRNDSSINKNPHVRVLTQKIAYHEQVRRRLKLLICPKYPTNTFYFVLAIESI